MIQLKNVSRVYPAQAEQASGVIRALDISRLRSIPANGCYHGPFRVRQIDDW